MFSRMYGLVCITLVFFAGSACTKRPSSNIPERRDFPVSKSIAPCTNFYAYACQPVIDTFKLRDDRTDHTFAFDDSAERLLSAKESFLANLPGRTNLSPRSAQLRDNFLACMHADASAKEERAIVAQQLAALDAITTNDAFAQFIADNILSPEHSFIVFDTIANLNDPSRWDLFLLGHEPALPERSYYDMPDVAAAFTQVVATQLRALGQSDADQRAADVVAFEKAYAQNYPIPELFDILLSTPTQITKAELVARYPNFRLSGLLAKIPDTTLIRNITPDNFAFLNDALGNSPLTLLKDVYRYHALTTYMDDAYPEFYTARFDFEHQHLGGPATRPHRSERCTRSMMRRLGRELDAELLPQLFPDFPRDRVVHIAERVRGSIVQSLQQNQWLSAAARNYAVEKIRAATLQLVHPTTDDDWDFSPPFVSDPATPYENLRRQKIAQLDKQLREIAEPRSRTRWGMGPLSVNAYYMPEDNTFVLPIGILQYPFFDIAASDDINLGGVGMIIGHELGHALDDNGAKYDAQGRLRQWMSEADLLAFAERTNQLVAQYNKAGLNGKLTLGENVADLMGITFAYHAAFPDTPPDAATAQRFFLQYAHLWCNVMRPAAKALQMKIDPHPYNEQRVNEPVKHLAVFGEAFQCKAGDPMFLPDAERLHLW